MKHFISRLKNLAAKCQFRDEVEDRVLDQLIWGSRNPDVQKSLISREKSLTLTAAIETARSYEATSKHMKTLAESSESHQEGRSIDAIYKEQERESCNNCRKQCYTLQQKVSSRVTSNIPTTKLAKNN